MGEVIILNIKKYLITIGLTFLLLSCAHNINVDNHNDAIPINDIILNAEKYHDKKVKFRAYAIPSLTAYVKKNKKFWLNPINLTDKKFEECYRYSDDPRFNENTRVIGFPKSEKDFFKLQKIREPTSDYIEIIAYGTVINKPKAILAVDVIIFPHQIKDIKILQITSNRCRFFY